MKADIYYGSVRLKLERVKNNKLGHATGVDKLSKDLKGVVYKAIEDEVVTDFAWCSRVSRLLPSHLRLYEIISATKVDGKYLGKTQYDIETNNLL
jgi:hypothetical protein